MKEENGEHRHGSQTINVCPVVTLYGCWMMHSYVKIEPSIASASRAGLVDVTVQINNNNKYMDE